MYWVSFVKLAFLEELSEEADEVEGGLGEDIVMAGIGDRDEGFLFRGREFVETFAMFEGNGLVFFSVDDEKGGIEFLDPFVVGETVTEEDGEMGHGSKGAQEGGDQNDGVMFFVSGEPAGGAGADGLADEDDLVGVDAEFGNEVLVGRFDGAVAAFFGGFAVAFSIAGEVVRDDAKALEVEGVEIGAKGFEVLGIAVRPEEGGHVWGGGAVVDGGVLVFAFEAGEVCVVLRVGGAGRLEDEFIGKEDGEEGEEEVDPPDGVKGTFPGPFADDDLFPIHIVRIEERSLFDADPS